VRCPGSSNRPSASQREFVSSSNKISYLFTTRDAVPANPIITAQLLCSWSRGNNMWEDNWQRRKGDGHTGSYVKKHQEKILGEDPP